MSLDIYSSSSGDKDHHVPLSLACYVCRRRKIKCGREKPFCSTCLISKQQCDYPAFSQKPGPKLGIPLDGRRKSSTQGRRQPPMLSNGGNRNSQEARGYDDVRVSQSAPKTTPFDPCAENGNSPSRHNNVRRPDSFEKPSPIQAPESTPGTTLNDYTEVLNTAGRTMPVWEVLEISENTYQSLLREYFKNMTSFSLFHKPSFDTKLRKIPRTAEIAALTASMFAFSARFVQDSAARSESSHGQEVIHCPTTDRFYRLASHYLEEAMDTEEVPSLCVLQALILTTFYQLSQDVRGRAWRSLGTCVRVAYEMELHLIDTKSFHFRNETVDVDNTRWIHDEERRRAWWALWELDIYASTIRRLPTGHDCTQIETLLPVGDEAWFSGVYQASCPLDPGPNSRWKVLKTSGNRGWKAWFIVIISMMRDAHLLSYSRVTHGILTSHGTTQAHGSAPVGWTRCRSEDSIMDGLKELGNSLTSLSMAIPPSLAYHNEYLSFQPERFPGGQSTLDADCAKYSIFLMTQLTKFMIHHYEMFWAARVADKMAGESEHLSVELRFGEGSFARTAINTKAWEQYLEAADNILHIIRSSSPYHIRYVNPHFSSTIWLAAVAQVVRKVFNPGPRESQVTQSKLDVLQYNFNSYVSFWNVSHALQHKLNTLEGRLETLQRFHDTNAKSASGSVHGVQDKGSETVHANSHAADNATQGQGSRTNLLQTTAAEDIVSSSETLYANTPNFLDGFHSCGPFGLSADMVNSSWALTTVDMEYNPSDYFNYDVKDFLNYSFDG